MDKNDHLAIGLYSCDRLLHALITAPIPHQSVVEIHKSALRYVREKLRKYYELRVLLEQMEIHRDMKIGRFPTHMQYKLFYDFATPYPNVTNR